MEYNAQASAGHRASGPFMTADRGFRACPFQVQAAGRFSILNTLYALASIRVPFLDTVFSLLTHLGSSVTAVAVPFIIFWCISKRHGYFVFANILFGTAVNQAAKFVCRVPRPFVRDPEFAIVENARADATGYSFPSGHTSTVTALFGSLAMIWKNTAARIACILIIVLVGFSRMYLGVHYPTDVLGGLVCGLVLLILLRYVFRKSRENPKLLPLLFGIGAAVTLAAALVIEFVPWQDADPSNWRSAVRNLNLIFGCMLAVAVCEPIERRHIQFDTRAVWWAQLLKIVLGLAVILGLRTVISPVISAVFGDMGIGSAILYFLMTSCAICVWPLTFRWFSRLGRSGK